jgi:hypothetical protein
MDINAARDERGTTSENFLFSNRCILYMFVYIAHSFVLSAQIGSSSLPYSLYVPTSFFLQEGAFLIFSVSELGSSLVRERTAGN